jgi:hypothetical protein
VKEESRKNKEEKRAIERWLHYNCGKWKEEEEEGEEAMSDGWMERRRAKLSERSDET